MSGSTHRDRFARPGGLGRLAVLTVAAAVMGTALLLRAAAVVPRTTTAATGLAVDRWVELAVLAAGLLAAAWLALSGALALTCVTASLLGRRWRAGEAAVERLAPGAVRRLVRTAVGVGVGAGLTLAPTVALAADVPPTPPAGHGASVVLDLGWQPTATEPDAPADGGVERPAEEAGTADGDTLVEEVVAAPVAHRAVDDAADGEADGGPTRVVHRGDTLWDIAADALGGSPTDAEILREVSRWHTENRDVIGADPDQLLPGQILRAPA
ncbi:LysM peptidoglycan-binding domain-containing protein [Isoptericola sp. NPDC056618]|uniref:LysM peptidoglycan-binding domain-containing protein n=1 Tax=Isoptericola sp. NPDC056618 TaxID=3345878 RepID=UPI0036B0CEBB